MRRASTLLMAEATLTLVTMAAVVGMHRLFLDGSYRTPLLAQALAAHVVIALARRARASLPVAAVLAVAGAGLMLAWAHYLDTTMALVPTPDTWAAASDDLSAAWRLFQDVRAPAPPETGFLIAGGASVWVMVFVADWAAFRAAATFEALLPSATLFLFAAALGAPGGRVAGAATYAGTAMLFVLLRRTVDQEETSAWAATHRARGRWSLLGSGTALIGVAVVAGAMAGPNLPGSEADPIIAWRDMNEDGETRIVVSPMVDIRARMVNQPNVEVFTVRSPEPSYWRLTSLDLFDGQIWKSSYGTSDANGRLPQAVDADVDIREVVQDYEITALAQVWVPAAYEPVALDIEGEGQVDWDERSSTLIVDDEVESSDGLSYQVTSNIPQWSADELRTATDEVPDDIAERYLQLPDGLNPEVEELARSLTAEATSPYDRAIALQQYLRTTFEYTLDAPQGHDSDYLSAFLFETQRGYCEQFAGSLAALARTVGLPSRVAVGFTQGIQDPDDPELYHVRGEHAHAWVEIYLHGYGWVTFDATPDRAPPRAEDWLGIAPAQTRPDTGDTPSPTSGDNGVPIPSPEGAGPGGPAGGGTEATGVVEAAADDTRGLPEDDGGVDLVEPVRKVGAPAAGVALAYLLIVPAAIVTLSALRWRRASTPRARVELEWGEALDRARFAGAPLAPSLTPSEAARTMAVALPEVTPAIEQLSGTVERVLYAEVLPSPEELAAAGEARTRIAEASSRLVPARRRVLRYLDVRELVRHRPARRRSAQVGS